MNLDQAIEQACRDVGIYFKPSVSKWVEGYWRGDIALGLHLKWYSPCLPSTGGIAA